MNPSPEILAAALAFVADEYVGLVTIEHAGYRLNFDVTGWEPLGNGTQRPIADLLSWEELAEVRSLVNAFFARRDLVRGRDWGRFEDRPPGMIAAAVLRLK
jgi:hypothetical protein